MLAHSTLKFFLAPNIVCPNENKDKLQKFAMGGWWLRPILVFSFGPSWTIWAAPWQYRQHFILAIKIFLTNFFTKIFFRPKIFWTLYYLIQKSFIPKCFGPIFFYNNFLNPILFLTQNFFDHEFVSNPNSVGPLICLDSKRGRNISPLWWMSLRMSSYAAIKASGVG